MRSLSGGLFEATRSADQTLQKTQKLQEEFVASMGIFRFDVVSWLAAVQTVVL